MKHSRISRKFFKITGLAMVMAVSLVACNDDDVVPVVDEAQIGVLNLLTDETNLDAHLGETKINTTAIGGDAFSYLTVDAGQANLSLFEAGETDTLASESHNFRAGEHFSAIVLGNKDDATLVITSDDLKAPAGGKAKIRFANFIDDEGILELWVDEAEEALQDDAAYKAVKAFVELEPATALTLQVKAAGSDEVLAELTEAQIASGKIYTVFVVNELVEGVESPVLRIVANK